MSITWTGDIFDRARAVAAAILVAAGLLGILGSFLDWVTITPPPPNIPGADFGEQDIARSEPSEPFTGIEARDGWVIIAASAIVAAAGTLLVLRARRRYATVALIASMVSGAIAISDYRGVNNLSSSISHRMDVVGDADPALGLALVAAAGFAGIAGAVLGFVATAARERLEE